MKKVEVKPGRDQNQFLLIFSENILDQGCRNFSPEQVASALARHVDRIILDDNPATRTATTAKFTDKGARTCLITVLGANRRRVAEIAEVITPQTAFHMHGDWQVVVDASLKRR